MRGQRKDTEQRTPRRRSRKAKALRISLLALGLVVTLLYGIGAAAADTLAPVSVAHQLAVLGFGPDCDAPEITGGDGELHYSAECPPPLGIGEDPPAMPAGDDGTLVVLGDSFTAGEGAPFGISRVATTQFGAEYWAYSEDYYYDGTDKPGNRCHRSPMAYGPRLAERLNLTLDFRACSGAVSSDYFGAQDNREGQGSQQAARPGDASHFPDDTRGVVFSFGGNDAGFANVVKGCLFDGYKPPSSVRGVPVSPVINAILDQIGALDCKNEAERRTRCLDYALGIVTDGVVENEAECQEAYPDGRYDTASVMAAIAAHAPPGVPVVALSYPYAFPNPPTDSCGFGSGTGAIMNTDEQSSINTFVDGLDDRLGDMATAAGIRYVDMRNAFQGHGLCVNPEPDDDPTTVNGERWMNRVRLGEPAEEALLTAGNPQDMSTFDPTRIFPGLNESAHPNAHGQGAYLAAANGCLRDIGFCSNAADARGNEDEAARAQERADHIAEITADTDWYAEASIARGCAYLDELPAPSPDELKATPVDVTGDDYPEMLIQFRCPTGTASSPMEIVVFDLRGDAPSALEYLKGSERGSAYFSLTATLVAANGAITITGRMFGLTDPPCCPLHYGEATWRWDGTNFTLQEVESALTDQAIVHEGLPDGTYYGILRGANGGEVLVDEVTRFVGSAAQVACGEDGVTPGGPGECADFYFRNDSQLVRALTIVGPLTYTPDEFGSLTVQAGDLGALGTDFPVSDEDQFRTGPVFRFGVLGGEVTFMEPGYP